MKGMFTIGLILLLTVLIFTTCSADYSPAIDSTSAQSAEELNSVGTDCWQGKILKTMYTTIGVLVMDQFDALTKGSLSMMMIGFAIWLALRLLKFVSSVREDSPGEIWNEIIRKAFICVFCGFLAYSSGSMFYVMDSFIFPIYAAFLEFGNEILQLTPAGATTVTVFGHTIDFTVFGINVNSTIESAQVSCAISGDVKASTTGFPTAFSDSMNCMVCTIADRLRIGRGIALTAISMKGVLPYIVGLILFAIFYVVGFSFVFYLIDSIFRFGLMIMMLPILVMAYAFGPTKKWTKIGFTNIMTSAAFMMAFSIIIATSLMALLNLISSNTEIFNPSDPELHMVNMSIATLSLLLVGFLIQSSLSVSQQLTSAIIGGRADPGFADKLKAGAQMVKGMLTKATGAIFKRLTHSQNTKFGRMMNSIGGLRGKLNELAGRNEE